MAPEVDPSLTDIANSPPFHTVEVTQKPGLPGLLRFQGILEGQFPTAAVKTLLL